MALVSGGRSSTLNPNAPLFVPASMRKVEDYSPQWWNLITTSTWFRDYWLSQHHQGEEDVNSVSVHDSNDLVHMLPDNIDCDVVDDEIFSMEAQYEEFLQSSEVYHNFYGIETANGIVINGYGNNADELMRKKNMGQSEQGRILKYPLDAAKNWGKTSITDIQSFIHRRQPR